MQALQIVFGILVLLFSFVLIFGAPFLPTKKQQIVTAFELLHLKKGATVIDLGSGDGRVLRYAASKGYRAVGYELNPIMYFISLLVTFKYRHLVSVKCKNFWTATLPQADAVFVFLLDSFMNRLHKKITQSFNGKNIKIVSFAFRFKDIEPKIEKNGVYLYEL